MKLYPINITKLGIILLPTMMRSALLVEWVRILLFPLQSVQTEFFSNRDKNIYLLNHNGQVCRLRKVLNDAFPARSKDFQIVDAVYTGMWKYAVDEEKLYEQLIIADQPEVVFVWDEETMTKFPDFIVRVPTDLNTVDNLNIIRALVNTYKLSSKKAIYELY
ncbi:MAG: hypothetical protein H6Q18_234 [Bacteroidetes bacterium]|nr:hypothetical protein [Bacteroidota bacterium]